MTHGGRGGGCPASRVPGLLGHETITEFVFGAHARLYFSKLRRRCCDLRKPGECGGGVGGRKLPPGRVCSLLTLSALSLTLPGPLGRASLAPLSVQQWEGLKHTRPSWVMEALGLIRTPHPHPETLVAGSGPSRRCQGLEAGRGSCCWACAWVFTDADGRFPGGLVRPPGAQRVSFPFPSLLPWKPRVCQGFRFRLRTWGWGGTCSAAPCPSTPWARVVSAAGRPRGGFPALGFPVPQHGQSGLSDAGPHTPLSRVHVGLPRRAHRKHFTLPLGVQEEPPPPAQAWRSLPHTCSYSKSQRPGCVALPTPLGLGFHSSGAHAGSGTPESVPLWFSDCYGNSYWDVLSLALNVYWGRWGK